MTLKELWHWPDIHEGYIRVWQRNFLHFKKTFSVSVFWTVLEPLMYLAGIGYGLGSYVNSINGVSYLDFFFPGLLCSTAMMVSFFEGTYGNYTRLSQQKIYSSIMLTQIGPAEIVFGELLWAASKGFFGICGVTLVASFFGLVDSYRIVFALLILFLLAWLFSCLAMIFTSMAKNYDSFIYATSGFILPMSLISGIYFPVEQLPSFLKIISYILPLTHGVAAVREVLTQGFTYTLLLHVCILILISYLLTNISLYKIRKKLLR